MWEILEKDNFWHGEIVNKHSNGSFYVELLTINRIVTKDGQVKNYIAVFTNITKQKKQEKLLKEKEQILFQQSKMAAMGEMLENIAHQWRQPLSIISTAASGIQVQKEFQILDEKVLDESLKLIVTTTEHLSGTIEDFRNFFKKDKEKINFLLAQAIEKSLNIVSSKFKNRSIVIKKELTGITVLGFENELVQVIMNILNNSRDALEKLKLEDRVIIIKTFIQENKAYLTIQDSGGGISEDIIDKVFEPYFTTKHQAQGTGIGLYMSAEIISKHMNGDLKVENKIFEYKDKKYKGAYFSIILPLN
jgi:signal transduction histidine kinase